MATFGKDFVRAATQPMFAQGLFTAAQAAGGEPARAQRREELSQFNPNTVEGLTGLAQYYQGRGDMQNAAKLATAAREMAANEARLTALTNRKAQIKTQAENLGLEDIAAQVENVTDTKELGDLVGTMLDYRLKNLPTQTPAQRKQLARQRGISDKLFNELGLDKAPSPPSPLLVALALSPTWLAPPPPPA